MTIQEEYTKLMAERSDKIQSMQDDIQGMYDKIRELQEKVKSVKETYEPALEELRKRAVETNDKTAKFLTGADAIRFNPTKVARSAEIRDLVIAQVLKNKQMMDEDAVYQIMKHYREHYSVSSEDMSKIYDAIDAADLYIHSM